MEHDVHDMDLSSLALLRFTFIHFLQTDFLYAAYLNIF